jgi:hypothetical protein
VTATNGQKAIIACSSVSKVIDNTSYRTIYQGSDTNNYQVTDSLAVILAAVNAAS